MRKPHRGQLRPYLALCAVTATLLAVTATGSPAVADPVSDAKARAAAAAQAATAAKSRVGNAQSRIVSVQHQLDTLQTQAEIAAEAYNAAVERLRWANSVAAAARARLARASASMLALRGRAGALAAAAYQTGGLSSLAALTDPAGPSRLLDRLSSLAAVAQSQRDTLHQLTVAEHERAIARVAAEQAADRQRALTAEKRRQRDAVLAATARSQELLGQLQVAQRQLIAQAQSAVQRASAANHAVDIAVARRALAIARARAAALARQRAAERAAARAFQRSGSGGSPPDSPGADGSGGGGLVLGSGGASVAVAWAYREIGKPYVWAADGPDSFDCSGLTQYVWAKAGVALSHYSGAQIGEGAPVSSGALRPGDLVFFGSPIHHVGIYVGGGMMIDAPHSGALVRKEPLWWGSYAGAVRPG